LTCEGQATEACPLCFAVLLYGRIRLSAERSGDCSEFTAGATDSSV